MEEKYISWRTKGVLVPLWSLIAKHDYSLSVQQMSLGISCGREINLHIMLVICIVQREKSISEM